MVAQKIYNNQFDRVQSQFRELRNVDPLLLETIYNMNEKSEVDAFQVEEEATKLFKGEIYNSNRPILQWEKEI